MGDLAEIYTGEMPRMRNVLLINALLVLAVCVGFGLMDHQAPARPIPTHARADAAVPETKVDMSVGATLTVKEDTGFWPCASTLDAWDDLTKWAALRDNTELKRTLLKTRSIGLNGGMRVEILDIGFFKRRVRVLTNTSGEAYLKDEKGVFKADPRIGRECWIMTEALQ